MQALVKEGAQLRLQELPLPEVGSADVLIRVRAAGLCRTDLLVMQGRLAAASPLIPGHELAGEVADLGAEVQGFRLGDRVTVHPQIGCGRCGACQRRQPERCPEVKMLGVDLHGAFAEYLCVPAHAVWQLPADCDWLQGAYAEPLAAMLGIFRAGMTAQQRGWVLGQNRIAVMTRRLLGLEGFHAGLGRLDEVEPDSLDYLIETGLSAAELPQALACLRPGGVLIAKSRHLDALPLPWSLLVRKDLRIQGLYYGDFAEALALLERPADVRGRLFEGLLGERFALADWALFASPGPEVSKPFLVLG